MMTAKTDRFVRVPVATVDELPPGTRKIVEVEGRSIGVFNVNGHYRAVLNLCPHELAPVCLGSVRGTTRPTDMPSHYDWHRDGEILACPWHGWEFDLISGKSLVDRRPLKLFPVEVEGDQIVVEVAKRR